MIWAFFFKKNLRGNLISFLIPYNIYLYFIMKYMVLLAFLLTALEVFPKENGEKTFLILFNSNDLQKINFSTEHIKINFLEIYNVKIYSGNSEAAILITVPNSDMDKCQMGDMLVQINHTTWIPLKEIAFRIIDLNESKENYHALLTGKDGELLSKSKNQLVRLKL